MTIQDIKELIRAVSESEIAALDYREGQEVLALRKEGAAAWQVAETATERAQEMPLKEKEITVSGEEKKPDTGSSDTYVVKCPLVGTVYMAPEEGAEPFVRVGDHVKKGQTLAIVEAMKLMNTIESEQDGTVKEILVENAHTVEYGEEMFIIC